ncbi:MAG: hypothetical protein WD895_05855 [Acidimicrobiia bacterium]
MESLGFSDSPAETTVTYVARGQTTTSVVTTRPTAPTGDMVQDLWDSTELDAPSLLDWKPVAPDRKHLRGRRFRWSRVFLVVMIAAVLGGGAYWLYQRPSAAAEASVAVVEDQATKLSAALDGVGDIGEQLSAPEIGVNLTASDLVDVDNAARGLFDASGDLPGSENATRSIAADAASLSFEVSRQMRDGLAYRGALEPILLAPALETDPALTDLTTAALEFSEWRAHFDSIRLALPDGVATTVTAALEDFSTSLETRQGFYLDAIRTNNPQGAATAIQALESDLGSIHELMMTNMSGLAGEVDSELDEARTLIGRLLG